MGRLNQYELCYPYAELDFCKDEDGICELHMWLGDDGEFMTFKLKKRADWELFRRSWRVIRRYGSVKIVDTQYHLQAHIFAADGAMWEVTRP